MSRFAAGILGRLLLLFPVFWVGGGMGLASIRCPGLVRQCAEMVVTSPFFAVFPAIVHEEEPPIETPHLAIFCVAVATAIAWEYVSLRRRRRY